MKWMLLQFLVFGLSTWSTTAITNRLLQNYERKLNSLHGFLERKQPDGKHRMKRTCNVEDHLVPPITDKPLHLLRAFLHHCRFCDSVAHKRITVSEMHISLFLAKYLIHYGFVGIQEPSVVDTIRERLHTRKRYRCIEEYVDEHGNVIEEGEEHFTTIAPITSRILETPWSGRQFHNVKRMHERTEPQAKGVAIIKPLKLIKVAVIKPTNRAKVTVIRRKLKSKKRKSAHNRRPIPDEDGTGMKRVFPTSTSSPSPSTTTTTPSTTTSMPRSTTTEVIELSGDESSDDVIMRKFFPEMQLTDDKLSLDRKDDGKSPATTTAASMERSVPYPPATLHSMNIASSLADEEQLDDRHMRAASSSSIRRHEASSYVKARDDYDNEYDDYSPHDFGDYAPYYRVNLRRRARPYPRVLMRRFPPRRFTQTKVPHIPVRHDHDNRLLMMAMDPVTEKPRKMDRMALPLATQQTWLPPSPAPLPPPPTAAQTLFLSTTASPQNTTSMEESTPRTCSKMRRLATTFGITDISVYARKNCRFLQTFAPGFTCEQIVHFVDSCHRNRLLE